MKNQSIKKANWTIGKMGIRLLLLLSCCYTGLSGSDCGNSVAQEASSQRVIDYPLIRRGFVFVNGTYVAPPYKFDVRGNELWINGHRMDADDLVLDAFLDLEVAGESFEPASWTMTIDSAQHIPPTPLVMLADAAQATAHMRGVVVVAEGEAPLLLEDSRSGYELLVTLLQRSQKPSGACPVTAVPEDLQTDAERKAWHRVVSDASVDSEFLNRARDAVNDVLAANATGERVTKASLWADNIAYPLTMFAMIVVVVAFGHLLSNKPYLEASADQNGVSPEAKKVVLKSLLIFGLLSIVDLVWTIAASSTGSMREMNPLGNELIQDPVRLIVFKGFAVILSITLLYALHRRPIAQMASWWSCLVLTLLTARWLTFNSMFM
jgi:hypothetical protein